MKKTNDLTRRPSLLEKKLRSCVLTGAFLGIMDYVLFLTDFAVSGRLLGESALSGLTVVNPFITFLTLANILLPAGTAAAIAFFQGKGDVQKCNRLFGQGILVTAFLGILFSFIVFAVSLVSLSEHMNISADVAYHAKQYLTGLIFMPLFMFFNTFLYYIHIGEGFEMTCIFSSAAKLLVNITLDIILCPIFGTFGIGIATMLGYLASLLVKLIPVIQKKLSLRFMRSFSAKEVLRLIADSLTLSADFIWPVLFSSVMNLSLLACFSDRILVIFSVILNVESLFMSIFSCMANSVQAGICQYFSEKNYIKIHRIITYMLCAIGVISCVLSILSVVFAGHVPGFFGIHDSSLNAEAVAAIRMYTPFAIFLGLSTMLSRYYVCIRHKAYGFFLSCISLVVLPFILQLILGLAIGNSGVWIGLGAGYLASFVLNFLFVSRLRRRQKQNCHLLFLYDLLIFSQVCHRSSSLLLLHPMNVFVSFFFSII